MNHSKEWICWLTPRTKAGIEKSNSSLATFGFTLSRNKMSVQTEQSFQFLFSTYVPTGPLYHFYIPQLPACLYSKNINYRDPSEPHTNCMQDHSTVKHCPWGCESSSIQKLANRKWPNTIILEQLPWCRNQAWSLLLLRLPWRIEPKLPFRGWNSVMVQ